MVYGLIAAVVLLVGGVALLRVRAAKIREAREAFMKELEAQPRPAANFETPEGAILVLEECYRRRDIERAVLCKDFMTEAQLMMKTLDPEGLMEEEDPEEEEEVDAPPLEELVVQMAETLELGFRKFTEADWPRFEGVESYFAGREPHESLENVVYVEEICRYPDGNVGRQRIMVSKTEKGWRVLIPAE